VQQKVKRLQTANTTVL